MRAIVVYDSQSGNTRKIAEVIAQAMSSVIVPVGQAPLDLTGHDLVIIGTPNIRAHPTEKMSSYLEKVALPKACALFVTFGMPIWGQISSVLCTRTVKKVLKRKGSQCVSLFMCPGYHVKYKTYQGRPSNHDVAKARRFALRTISMV